MPKEAKKPIPQSEVPAGFKVVGQIKLPIGKAIEAELMGCKRVASGRGGPGKYFHVLSLNVDGSPCTMTCGSVLFSALQAAQPAIHDSLWIKREDNLPASGSKNAAHNYTLAVKAQGGTEIPACFLDSSSPQSDEPPADPA